MDGGGKGRCSSLTGKEGEGTHSAGILGDNLGPLLSSVIVNRHCSASLPSWTSFFLKGNLGLWCSNKK